MAPMFTSLTALAAFYSLAGIAAAIILVIALHHLEPEFDPSWRMLSEYSLGQYGVLMRLAFILGGTGVLASGVALWDAAGVLVLGLPLVALGPIGAAFIDTDPITTPRPELTGRSKVHAGLGSLFILGFPVAATCAGVGAGAHSMAGQLLAWSVVIPWAGLIGFLGVTVRFAQSAVGKKEVRIGWPNRFNMLAYLAWVALADILTLIRAV